MIKRTGVYRIKCLVTQRCYIGSSVNMDGRIATHIRELCWGNHPNVELQQDWAEHHIENFRFKILWQTDKSVSKAKLLEVEREILLHYENTYNIYKQCDPTGHAVSQEHRDKIGVALKKAWKNPELRAKQQKKYTPEWRAAQSAAQSKRAKAIWSDPVRAQLQREKINEGIRRAQEQNKT